MKPIVSAEEMKKLDANTIGFFHVPSLVLMERAAYSVYETVVDMIKGSDPVLIVCGTGNNGADGLALARMLFLDGIPVNVVLLGDEAKCTEENARQLLILRSYKIPIYTEIRAQSYSMVIDAIFGVGLKRNVEGIYSEVVEQMNLIDATKVAVDIPSGVNTDTGNIMGNAFAADITVTFACHKYGHLLYPGKGYCGKVIVKDIGITKLSALEMTVRGMAPEPSDLSKLPLRISQSNKATYGRVLSICGSKDMAGAGVFCSKSAYLAGAGIVDVFTPEVNRNIIQTAVPEAVLTSYDPAGDEYITKLETALSKCTVCVAGCGLSTSDVAHDIMMCVLSKGNVPLVLDADALNLIAASSQLRDLLNAYPEDKIFTPHLKEASRLLECEVADIKTDLREAAADISEKYECNVVLKDAASVIYTLRGKLYVNTSGNDGMSKGGSGDVLAGIVAGLVACGAKCDTAAYMGAYLHGLAGDEAVKTTGNYSLMATDLMEGIKAVLRKKDENGAS
ncbi:MAG: NAD(P)H-hydrate dehydratase [Eubacterium sp.]|nr:NAD(P)H-hydrate dehydratase [Eubacterium sp.]